MSDAKKQKAGEEPKKRGRRSLFTDGQREILLRYFDNGMTSTKRKHMEMIEKCATECSTDVERIKRFIGAENYKRKKAEVNEVVEEVEKVKETSPPPPPRETRKRRSQSKPQTRQKKGKTNENEEAED